MRSPYIELRGDNLLEAVIVGTEANAHLVATAVLAQGLQATIEQYHISAEKVLAALKFYLDNRAVIEQSYDEKWQISTAWRGEEWTTELKRRSNNLKETSKDNS